MANNIYDDNLFCIINKNDIKVGDVIAITYSFGDTISNKENKILIIDDKLDAVWYETDVYSGKDYIILPYQIITRIIKRNVDVKKYLQEHSEIPIEETEDMWYNDIDELENSLI